VSVETILSSFRDFAQFLPILDFVLPLSIVMACHILYGRP